MNSKDTNDTIVYIYGLFDPREPEHIRYVGRSCQLKQRIKNHIKDKKETSHKANWIRKLLKDGVELNYTIIEQCNEYTWIEREIYWIEKYRKDGHNLTNANGGGLGSYNLCKESREKISKALKGKCFRTPEGTEKLRQSLKNRVYTDEMRKNMSTPRIGKCFMSKEGREKVGKSNKKRTISSATREKMSQKSKEQGVKYNFNNELLTVAEASIKYNIQPGTIRSRIRKNVPPSIAILDAHQIKKYLLQHYPSSTEKYSFEGELLTVKEAAEKYKFKYYDLRRRLLKIDLNSDIKLHMIEIKKAKKYLFNNEELTIKEAALKYNISEITIRTRISRGYSNDSAINQ